MDEYILFPANQQSTGSDEDRSTCHPAFAQTNNNKRQPGRSLDGDEDNNNSSKKMRTINEIPPVTTGVHSASKTPVVDEETCRVETIEVDALSCFFDEPITYNTFPKYAVAKRVLGKLKDNKASEEALRNAIYTDLMLNHGIQFPESSFRAAQPSGTTRFIAKLNPTQKPQTYVETDLASLLREYGAKVKHSTTAMDRIMQGLPVTTTSKLKPDLAQLDLREPLQIRFGEFKNRHIYSAETARSQCIMYLIGLLYWLRVDVGKPVEAVFGFYFCGRRCSDQDNYKNYEVGLVKLTAPRYLGDEMVATYLESHAAISNLTPLRMLIHFLKEGKRWVVSSRARAPMTRIPCLFTPPSNLWENDQDRSLVCHGGTLSIVFRITAQGLHALIMKEQSPHFKNFRRHDNNWREFRRAVSKLNVKDATWYYLKMRTRDTAWQADPMGPFWDVWDVLTSQESHEASEVLRRSITGTYLLPPYITSKVGVVLMRDRGKPLTTVGKFGPEIFSEFKKIMVVAMVLVDILPHGDALPHNIVYDETSNELTLIDVDEGVRKKKCAQVDPRDRLCHRQNSYREDGEDWCRALSYPNVLLDNATAYTQSQLVASFTYFMRHKIDIAPTRLRASFYGLLVKTKEVGEDIRNLDNNKVGGNASEELIARVGEIYVAMSQMVDQGIAGSQPSA